MIDNWLFESLEQGIRVLLFSVKSSAHNMWLLFLTCFFTNSFSLKTGTSSFSFIYGYLSFTIFWYNCLHYIHYTTYNLQRVQQTKEDYFSQHAFLQTFFFEDFFFKLVNSSANKMWLLFSTTFFLWKLVLLLFSLIYG